MESALRVAALRSQQCELRDRRKMLEQREKLRAATHREFDIIHVRNLRRTLTVLGKQQRAASEREGDIVKRIAELHERLGATRDRTVGGASVQCVCVCVRVGANPRSQGA